MATAPGPPSGGSVEVDLYERPRRRIAVPVATTAAGGLVISGRGRLVGWSLLDTQGLQGTTVLPQPTSGYANATGTLLTLPASATWTGIIVLRAAVLVAAGGAQVTPTPKVTSPGGVTPTGTLLQLSLVAGAVGATATNPDRDDDVAVWGPGSIVTPAGGNQNISLDASTATKVDAWAVGVTTFGTATADGTVVEFYDGSDATGTLLAVAQWDAGRSVITPMAENGPDYCGGVFLRVVSGSVRGSVWVQPDDA